MLTTVLFSVAKKSCRGEIVAREKLKEALLTVPSFAWMTVFFFLPTLIIAVYSFKPADLYGGVESGWTLNTLFSLYDPYIFSILWRTLWISAVATMISLLLALPVGYHISVTEKKWRNFYLILIVIPFWSSLLIRIFAWKTILHPEGALHNFLAALKIISPETTLLYNSFSVVLIMVYTFIPFAVLPIYTSASKFNFQLVEAAMDLGASRLRSFWQVFVPGIRKGISTAAMMVFIPAFGTYVIPDLVGGIHSEMIGNKIAQKVFIERNLPQASAMSLLLGLVVLIPIAAAALYFKKGKLIEVASRNRE